MAGIMQTIDQFALGAGVTASHSRVYVLASLSAAALIILLFISTMTSQSNARQSLSMGHTESHASLPSTPTLPASNQSEVQVNQSTNSDSASKPTISTNVRVNGKAVPLPSNNNGTVHKEITSSNGSKTSVDVTVDSHSSSSTSIFNLNVDSHQSSTVNKSG